MSLRSRRREEAEYLSHEESWVITDFREQVSGSGPDECAASPLTPALSPLRGEGVAAEARRTTDTRRRVPAISSCGAAASAASGELFSDNAGRAPSPLNGERAGVRGEAIPSVDLTFRASTPAFCFKTKISFLLSLAALFLIATVLTGCATSKGTGVSSATNAPPQPYMRVARPDSNTVALQIALRSFAPPKGRGPVVWLSGASHVGDSNYFAALQRHLDAQALVLFEGVGAKDKKMRFNPDEGASIQHTMAESLGLVFQLSAVNYDRPHFRNSDLTIAQLQQLLTGGVTTNRGGTSANAKANEEFQQLLQIMDGSSFLGTLLHAGFKLIGSSPKLQAMTKVMLIEVLGQLKGDMAQLKGVPPEFQRLLESFRGIQHKRLVREDK